jgi:hypothetical protein
VGRITTAGALSIVSLPNHLSLDRITAKPDGTIWAIANSADRIVAITTNMAAPDTPGRDATLSFGCRSPESRCTVAVDSLTATTTHLNALLIRRGTVCGSGSAHPSGPHAVVVIAPKHPIRRGGYELRVTISGAARTTTISLPERIG